MRPQQSCVGHDARDVCLFEEAGHAGGNGFGERGDLFQGDDMNWIERLQVITTRFDSLFDSSSSN